MKTTNVDPMVEDTYWRGHFADRPYVDKGVSYSDYSPAYRYGWESYNRYHGRKFDDVETELERGWDKVKGGSKLTWMKAKNAVRDAWHRIERVLPGDADNDGR